MERLVEGLPEVRIPVKVEPGSKTLPSPFAEEEVDRLKGIKGRVTRAYYLGRAVAANALMATSKHNRLGLECWQRNVQVLRGIVKEVEAEPLLRAGYNKGVVHELIAREFILPSR